jgi:hypothetical protein
LFCLPDLWDIAKEICRTVDAWFDKIKWFFYWFETIKDVGTEFEQ